MKEKYKEIMRYHKANLSQRQIPDVLKVSRNTVSKVLAAARAEDLIWDDVREMTELELTQRLFPKPTRDCHLMEKIPLQYSQFCVNFNQYVEKNKATMHFEHNPGEKIEVDWAGQTLKIVDPETGKEEKAYLFVATLPYSQYSYVEVTSDMRQENWITAHVNMYHYFGGVSSILICDNLKTGVIDHPRHGDILLNAQYRELADYYDTAILPAKPRTPKGKASVEGTVGKVSTDILARLRNKPFHSVYEANEHVQEQLEAFNKRPFQKRRGSRVEVFFSEEKPYLQPLPRTPYIYGEWKIAKVQYHYHISVDKMLYSVPYQFIGQKVKVRMTHHLIEIFSGQSRICSHKRLHGHPGQYSTIEDHMPEKHRQVSDWNGDRFISWSKKNR